MMAGAKDRVVLEELIQFNKDFSVKVMHWRCMLWLALRTHYFCGGVF